MARPQPAAAQAAGGLRGVVIRPPASEAFSGTFEGSDTFEVRPIRARFTWPGITTPAPRREQAFSDDGGRLRDTSWVMEFTQARARRGRYPMQAEPAARPGAAA